MSDAAKQDRQPARLTALRLVGFKSFAERTTIEFGPGISAVVGPNGSGKSNLADALRWTLGEQGRQLRTRRAEDVIFAGSSSRKAIGMADVTLVIDNTDRLLPVEFEEVEIGRRLYRSGENEYLLNRQRIRLRDLVETLDAGNLADNAFLFIGQGMVDQALALRPEERRPLFEEAAGVRRHERRRRQAEQELAEAESNLERLRDLLGELRPQAKRLSAQAEQLQARRTAGLELAEALLASARARWIASAATERLEARLLKEAHDAADAALAELHAAEEAAASTSEQMASHAEQERDRRDRLERHRARIVELRVTQARLGSELESLARETGRLTGEREILEARLRDSTMLTSAPAPAADSSLAADIVTVERGLAEATALVGADSDAAAFASLAREAETRRNETQQSAARAADAEAAASTAAEQVARLKLRLTEAETERDAAVEELATTTASETAAQVDHDQARAAASNASASSIQLADQLRQLESEASSAHAALAALDSALEATVDDGLARAARARGGSLVAEGLEVESKFRQAVSAALGAAATGLAVDDAAPLLSTRRQGTLVVRGGSGRRRGLASSTASGPVVAAARESGGGSLTESIRRDPQSEVTRLLDRVVWVPDMGAALRLAPSLLPGWRCVTLAGDLISDEGVIWLASERSVLDQRAERDGLRRRVTDLDQRLAADRAAAAAAREAADTAIAQVTSTQLVLDEARKARRAAEERERVAQRRAEQWLRELTWETSQAERLSAEATSARESADRATSDLAALETRLAAVTGEGGTDDVQSRIAELSKRREELLAQRAADEQRINSLLEVRRTAEIRRTIDETRLAEIDAEHAQLTPRQTELSAQKEQLGTDLAAAQAEEAQAAADLNEVLEIGAADRGRLIEAEKAAADARERLRVAEQQTRKSEVTQMEARLQLEQIREQLLVELAGIGTDGLLALHHAKGGEGDAAQPSEEDVSSGEAYEGALAKVVEAWQSTDTFDQQAIEAPGASRIGTLRRRFHELGAGNPFAAEEYEELRERLDAMESQRVDLESAIASTRELIANLTAMITDQFRKTFAALEDAFARRFKELFGGGDAELSLTAPEDLSATGVEIHARPPGKKRQPLSMLSGGERALTAVSLLLAMLEVRPVPFCVLDEVDAALDEANVNRFSKALRGLAEQTQFIVITHNRGTIEGADALYGVTIGDDAVSRVVSLRLPKPVTNGEGGKSIALDETTDVEPIEPSEAALA